MNDLNEQAKELVRQDNEAYREQIQDQANELLDLQMRLERLNDAIAEVEAQDWTPELDRVMFDRPGGLVAERDAVQEDIDSIETYLEGMNCPWL